MICELNTWQIFWLCVFSLFIISVILDYVTRPFRQEELKAKAIAQCKESQEY